MVVGRRKAAKKRIERESGARIQMLPPSADLDGEHWTCKITGSRENSAMAAKIIQDLIDNFQVYTLVFFYSFMS